MIGQTLAHYKILETLGSGGMGDVYLAEDTKLDRKVALKVLPPELAENEERRARFQREAKAIAALDHPNIVQVFSVEEAEGTHFITMQLVQGKTLTELLPKNGFPLSKFFDIAIPLADAVAAAHEQGITHRDLKPDNIMVSDDGRVKVLDFGLAKLLGGFTGSEGLTAAKTEEGIIVGTVAYMSPEQAEGNPVDHRTDVFSLGIVLYEMATGRKPFHGETPASTLSSIIKDTPSSVTDINPALPTLLSRVIRRCLAKDPERRYQSAKDLRNELEELQQDIESGETFVTSVSGSGARARLWTPFLMVVVIAGLLALAWRTGILPGSDAQPLGPSVPRLTNPIQVTAAAGVEDFPTWSPNGETIAFHSRRIGRAGSIWVVQVGGPPVNRTAQQSGTSEYPSWSPDGRRIAFLTYGDGAEVFVMPALAGPPQKIVSWPPDELTIFPSPLRWSSDGAQLAFGGRDESGQIVGILDVETGEVIRSLPAPARPVNQILDLTWSPDGRFFAYVDAMNRSAPVTGVWVLRAADGETFQVTDGQWTDWSPSWSPDSRTLFFVSNRGGSNDIWQQLVNDDGEPIEDPQAITAGVGMVRAELSGDGTKLVYTKGREVANVWRVPILADRPATWSDATQITFDEALIEFIDVSPDGSKLALNSDRSGNHDLWVLPLDGGEMQQLTSDPTPDWYPRWSPDGEQIAFYAYRSGNRDIWVMPADGGRARQLTKHEALDAWPAWSLDGQQLAFMSARGGSDDIWTVPIDGGEPKQFTHDPGAEWSPVWSSDGQHIVFAAAPNRGATFELWQQPLAGGEPRPLVDAAASSHRRSRDGEEIFYIGEARSSSMTGLYGDIWAVSADGGRRRRLTELTGRYGSLRGNGLATDGDHLYFVWAEDLGDIWVMDVVTDED